MVFHPSVPLKIAYLTSVLKVAIKRTAFSFVLITRDCHFFIVQLHCIISVTCESFERCIIYYVHNASYHIYYSTDVSAFHMFRKPLLQQRISQNSDIKYSVFSQTVYVLCKYLLQNLCGNRKVL